MNEADVTTKTELSTALETIQQQSRSLEEFRSERIEPIAVIGVGLRFPGANETLDGFDEFLREGRSGICPLPQPRWRVDNSATDGKITATGGGFLDRVDEFDAQFFNISPKQAPFVDPQQRLLLETAWHALENAAVDPGPLRHGNGGIYIGASPLDFMLELESLDHDQLDGSLGVGMGAYSLSGRLSYFLGWRGPSLTTDTACASSLTALHLAVEGLRHRETDIALCGGVNVLHNPRSFIILSNAQMLAPDGRCKSFDEAADGYARAEGCGVLVLKRLSDARRDGDTVLALVRGTAIGQDGESAGLTAPNGMAQEAVMRAALANSRLVPADIQYVEAHGTGTPLGDPIEMESVNGVFGAAHRDGDRVTVGSLKSNIGHMEPAAGVGAIIKVILQLRAGTFYPSLISTPSGRIPWDIYPVRVPTECLQWEGPVRRAMVNGFGVAGAIGVAVVEEAPEPPADREPLAQPDEGGHIFTVSATSEPALRRQVERYQRFLAENPHLDVADLCYTSNVGRTHFRHRAAGSVRGRDELVTLLGQEPTGNRGSFRKAAFLFTGSGSQYAGMGAALYRQFPEFRSRVDECDKLFTAHLARSVADILLGLAPDATAVIAETRYAHAALFTLEYALAGLWRSWGVQPSVLIGHSVGELVAATVAGVFTLSDGVAFVVARAGLIESIDVVGGMAAVGAPVADVAAVIERWPDLGIAAINSPSQCVVSGGADSLAEAVEQLRELGMAARPLNVSSPFHSPLIARISEQLREVLGRIEFHEPELTIISNLTGAVVSPAEITTADYWVRHVNDAVDFAAGVRAIADRGKHVFIEIGPSRALLSLVGQCLKAEHLSLPSLHPKDAEATTIRQSLAEVYAAGLPVSWRQVHAGRERHRIELPGYAFDRRRYWLPNRPRPTGTTYSLLGRKTTPQEFVSMISSAHPAYLADHTAGGRAFLPAAAYVEMLLALADAHHGCECEITNIRFHEAMFLTDESVEVRTSATLDDDGQMNVEITSDGRRCATAALKPPDQRVLNQTGLDLMTRLAEPGDPDQILDSAMVYAAYARAGLDYGPQFGRVMSVVRYGDDLTVSELSGQDVSPHEYLPPPVMDAATHGLAALVDDGDNYVATTIAHVRVFKKPRADRLRAVLRITWQDSGEHAFTIDTLLLEGDTPVAEVTRMGFARLARPASAVVPSRPSSTIPEPTPPESPSGIADLIKRIVADLLSIDDTSVLDGSTTFLELGVDSLVAVDLRAKLQARLRVSLPASVVFDQPSVEQLAEFVGHQLTGMTDQPVSLL